MSRKSITVCMVLFAVAASAMPSTASASPVLTHPTGTTLATGSTLVGAGIGTSYFKDGSGSVLAQCSIAKFKGSLVSIFPPEWTITTWTLEGTGSVWNGMHECTGSSFGFGNVTYTTNGGGVDGENVTNGTPYCLRMTGLVSFSQRGGACSQAARKITIILDSTNFGECKYERSTAITGTGTSDTSGSSVLTWAPNETTRFTRAEGGSVLCPSTGSLEMSYRLETENGEPIYIS